MSPAATDPVSFLPLRPQELAVLMILEHGPRHAYGIAHASEREATVRLEIGSLYRMLNRLATAGLIEDAAAEAIPAGPAGIRRGYALTALGRAVAAAEIDRLETVVDAARSGRLAGERGGS